MFKAFLIYFKLHLTLRMGLAKFKLLLAFWSAADSRNGSNEVLGIELVTVDSKGAQDRVLESIAVLTTTLRRPAVRDPSAGN